MDSDSIDLVYKKKKFERKWNEESKISKPKRIETAHDRSLSGHDESGPESAVESVESDGSEESTIHSVHAMVLLGSFK